MVVKPALVFSSSVVLVFSSSSDEVGIVCLHLTTSVVLEHTDTPKPDVNVDCQAVAYQ